MASKGTTRRPGASTAGADAPAEDWQSIADPIERIRARDRAVRAAVDAENEARRQAIAGQRGEVRVHG